ncbi:MAG TPA: alginate lyase family protein [Nannocystaceae bacterium]|nr:alginate lyase family protein [Nannocystaceae bacterium]
MRSSSPPCLALSLLVACTAQGDGAADFGEASTADAGDDTGGDSGANGTTTMPAPGETAGATDGAASDDDDGSSSAAYSDATGDAPLPVADGIWISTDEIAALPTEGEAWESLLEHAMASPGIPNLSDQDQDDNIEVLARAFVCVRLADDAMCETVRTAVVAAMGSEDGGRTLALGRELFAYIVAAELVGLSEADDAAFREWLAGVVVEELDGRTLVSTHEDRPNNWGTHAGASRLAAAIYLDDQAAIDRCADEFHGWLGARDVYAEFEYGELDWQADASAPVGINPVGAMRDGHSIDGVIPDDQRRAGGFTWPPPQENYVYGALEGALVQAAVLHRRGYPAFDWEDQALLRAVEWLHDEADYPAEGDDTWQPHVVNYFYGTDFPAPIPAATGKNVAYTDWTHAP